MTDLSTTEATMETAVGAVSSDARRDIARTAGRDPGEAPIDGARSRATSSRGGSVAEGATRVTRKRGRPALMTRDELLSLIRERAANPDGLFRVHLTDSDLYARARRMFGSWAFALAAAGVDYRSIIATARARSLETRRRRV
ncbi:MAG: hypothetical protein ACHQ52_06185 [Candidatus Eisenbacteria bacterium]